MEGNQMENIAAPDRMEQRSETDRPDADLDFIRLLSESERSSVSDGVLSGAGLPDLSIGERGRDNSAGSQTQEPVSGEGMLAALGNYMSQFKDDLKALAQNPGDAIKHMFNGARAELTEHPLRVAASVATGAVLTVALGVAAAALVPELAAGIGIGLAVASVGLLGLQALKALKDIAHDVKVLNDPRGSGDREAARRDLEGYGAGLLNTAGALAGALAGGGIAAGLSRLGVDIGPIKTNLVYDRRWGYIEKEIQPVMKDIVKTLIPGGLIALNAGSLLGAYGYIDRYFSRSR